MVDFREDLDEFGSRPSRVNILGVHVSATSIPETAIHITRALARGDRGYICVTGVHGVIEAQDDPELRRILNSSLLTVPDGMPLVWLGRHQGFHTMARVYGPDLMLAVAGAGQAQGWRHFLLGGKPGIGNELRDNLLARFPGLKITGTYTPPFRPLKPEEESELRRKVKDAQPDIIWVALSTPKQEKFMAEYLPQLETKIMVGVGAAFDIITGHLRDAPAWIKVSGLQWLHRLAQEPQRLFGRYARCVPGFLLLSALQLSGLKKYPEQG